MWRKLLTYTLPNGNTLLWLGKGGNWGESDGLDNAMILSGGDVLFLKTIKTISLNSEIIRNDLLRLNYKEFIEKYKLPDKYDIWEELRRGVKVGEYPTYNKQKK